MGFFVPPRLRLGRWALTPPFHPYRHACAQRRFVFCDTFRQPQLSPRFPACSPRHVALWCPDFPLHVALQHTQSDRPPSPLKVVNAGGCARRQFRQPFSLVAALYECRIVTHRRSQSAACERTYMKSTSESLSHPETSNGRGAGGNRVVVRRGSEQPEADLWSQTKVNPIRFAAAASLLASGEASGKSDIRFLTHSSYRGGETGCWMAGVGMRGRCHM